MAGKLVPLDRIFETSVTTGVGEYTLDGAQVGFEPFSAIGANNVAPYFATDGTNWEVGIGTYVAAPSRLQRTSILASSNGGAAVNWAAGTRNLRCGLPAALGLPRRLSKSVAGAADVTLNLDEAFRGILEFTGALTGNINVIVPTTEWQWTIFNNTSGAYGLTVKTVAGTGVPVAQGGRSLLHCDGTNVAAALDSVISGGRLTKSGANLLFSQFNGNFVKFPTGIFLPIGSAGITLAIGAALTEGGVPAANTTYLIYAYNNAGVLALQASATAHATDAATGIEIRNGDSTRVLVGMARTSAAPAWVDVAAQRFTISYFNRRTIGAFNSFGANRTTTSGAMAEFSADKAEFITWADEAVSAQGCGYKSLATGAGGASVTYVTFDGASSNQVSTSNPGNSYNEQWAVCTQPLFLAEGYHFADIAGSTSGGVTGTWATAAQNVIGVFLRG